MRHSRYVAVHQDPPRPGQHWPVLCNWVCVTVLVTVALAVGVVVLLLSAGPPPRQPGAVYVTPDPTR